MHQKRPIGCGTIIIHTLLDAVGGHHYCHFDKRLELTSCFLWIDKWGRALVTYPLS
jgi:hypothetical protein